MKQQIATLASMQFTQWFKKEPDFIVLSPGRINIIGEHIDYNDGFVLPAAINKYICFAFSKNEDSRCTIYAHDLNQSHEFNLNDDIKPIDKMWANYILGVLHQLKSKGYMMQGFNMVFSSTIPMGAGLSSSAALECGIGYAMNKMFSLGLKNEEIALIGQKAEQTFVGVNCGIMDQFASVFGKKNQVIKLDCDSLEYQYHKADLKNYSLLLLDSKVKHTHLTSGYNDRRNEVELGLKIIKEQFPEVNTFRDCTEDMILGLKEKLGAVIFRRCHFVVKEIRRVLNAVEALEASDFKTLGRLISETHQGLSKEYQVSCQEIDFLVDTAQQLPTVLGARIMGGGFGGCSINLVTKGAEDDIINHVAKQYQSHFGIELKAYKIKISQGITTYKS